MVQVHSQIIPSRPFIPRPCVTDSLVLIRRAFGDAEAGPGFCQSQCEE